MAQGWRMRRRQTAPIVGQVNYSQGKDGNQRRSGRAEGSVRVRELTHSRCETCVLLSLVNGRATPPCKRHARGGRGHNIQFISKQLNANSSIYLQHENMSNLNYAHTISKMVSYIDHRGSLCPVSMAPLKKKTKVFCVKRSTKQESAALFPKVSL